MLWHRRCVHYHRESGSIAGWIRSMLLTACRDAGGNPQDHRGKGPCRGRIRFGRPHESPLRRASACGPELHPAAGENHWPGRRSVVEHHCWQAVRVIRTIQPGPRLDFWSSRRVPRRRRRSWPTRWRGRDVACKTPGPARCSLWTWPGGAGPALPGAGAAGPARTPMGQLEVSISDAMAILRSHAFAADIELTDVAEVCSGPRA